MPVSHSVSKMSFVASPTYLRSSPLQTVGSNSRKLIRRFSKRLVHFRQRRPTLAWSLSGSNGASGDRPLRRTFALVLELAALEAAPCGTCVPGVGGGFFRIAHCCWVSLGCEDDSCLLSLKSFQVILVATFVLILMTLYCSRPKRMGTC